MPVAERKTAWWLERTPVITAITAVVLLCVSFAMTVSYLDRRALLRKTEVEAFAEGGSGVKLLRSGWSWQEPWGTWSNGPVSMLAWPLKATPNSPIQVWVDGRIYPFFEQPAQTIDVSVNGKQIATLERNFEGGLFGGTFRVPAQVAVTKSPMEIVFSIKKPTSPKSIGDGTDTRLLGLGLKSIELEYDAQ